MEATAIDKSAKNAKSAKIAETVSTEEKSTKIALVITNVFVSDDNSRIGMKFSHADTLGLSYFIPTEWVHRKLKKFIGKEMSEMQADLIVGSSVYCSSIEVFEAGDTIVGKDGKPVILKKDRLELNDFAGLVLDRKQVLSNLKDLRKAGLSECTKATRISKLGKKQKTVAEAAAKSTLNF